MLLKLKEFVRGKDLFAVPVQLNYKGQRKFNTLLGGCCSIFLLVGILVAFSFNLYYHIDEPEFIKSSTNSYLSYDNNTMPFEMST